SQRPCGAAGRRIATSSEKFAERVMNQENKPLAFVARLCLVLIFPFSALDKIFNHKSALAQAGEGLIALPRSMAVLLLVLGGKLRCCSCSMSSSPPSCSTIFGAFRSVAIRGRRTSGRS